MPKPSPFRPFTPEPEQMALRPDLSGNVINGLGETEARAPRVVYWAPDPDAIPHGAMQRWFYQVDPDNPLLARARAARAELMASPVPEVHGDPVQRAPARVRGRRLLPALPGLRGCLPAGGDRPGQADGSGRRFRQR